MIKTQAYARAGLIGNPSDGFFGKTIALSLTRFPAEVILYESPELTIEPHALDSSTFESLDALVRDVRSHGYYGGLRLIKATLKRFADHCAGEGLALDRRTFTIRYNSTIPRLVGMAGSSAIITAALRALMQFYGVSIPRPVQANLILSVERDELGISAGLQDRVIQVYEGLVYMDFDRALIEQQGYGAYEPLDPRLLPPLYVACDPDRAEGSERTHNRVRALYEAGDRKIFDTLAEIAGLAGEARDLLLAGGGDRIGPLMDRNFDLRSAIIPISPENRRMVETARQTGASAKFAGSGGAIVGLYEDETMFRALETSLGAIGCRVFKPEFP